MKRISSIFVAFFACLVFMASFMTTANAAPYAAAVIDARDGRVIYSRNANQPLHPASLTKMMTLYIAFSEIEAGRLRIDQQIPISANAANEPPSKIGLKAGTTMELRYLLRAAAIKSANDASTAIAEAIGGSEANFAHYMTQVARGIGMRNTQFKNAHGLTENGHISTAADMALLGRRLVYDYPNYYQIFSREYANTPLGNFRNSNRRFLSDYVGADGIKTGYTSAAGYNLVGSAKRGDVRIIVSMFGGESSYQRNAQIGALLDLGFKQAQPNVPFANLAKVRLSGPGNYTPAPAPAPATPTPAAPAQPEIQLAAAPVAPATATVATAGQVVSSPTVPAAPAAAEPAVAANVAKLPIPASRPSQLSAGQSFPQFSVANSGNAAEAAPSAEADSGASVAKAGNFAIQLGAKPNKAEAESYLVATALKDEDVLGGAEQRVIAVNLNGTQMYRPRFSGLSEKGAYDACGAIQGRNEQCYVIAP